MMVISDEGREMTDPVPWLDKAVAHFDEARRPLAVIAVLTFVAGLVLLEVGAAGPAWWMGLVLLGIAILAVAVLVGSLVRPLVSRPVVHVTENGGVAGGRLVIGVHAGRTTIEFGLVELAGDPATPLGGLAVREVVPRQVRRWPGTGREAIYSDITSAVVGLLEGYAGDGIDAIAIALPGLVNIGGRSLQTSAGGLPPNSLVADEIAQRIMAAPAAIRRNLRHADDGASLAKRVFIDNDARSLGRFVWNNQPAGWRNYACIMASDGVGSALVLDRRLYYGSYCSAGEAGHQTLELAAGSVITASGTGRGITADLPVPACRCRKTGLHFEMVANDTGVSRLARAIAPETYGRIAKVLDGGQGDLIPYRMLLDLAAISLGQSAPDGRIDERLVAVLDSDEHRDFFARLVDEYGRLLTIGVANLINVLDLDNVVLTGPVVSAFDAIDGFSQALQKYRAEYVLREDRVGLQIEPRLASRVWEGVALAIRDPQYGDLVAGHRGT